MLGTERDHLIRNVVNGTAVNPEAESKDFRADLIAAIWPSGPTLPTAASQKWPGRSFFHEVERAWYVCDHNGQWLAVGGQYAVLLQDFGAPASGYVYDNTQGASYVYRSGKRVDVRLRIRNTAADPKLVHGSPVFQIASAYRPAGIGAWPLAAIQAGGAASASVVAAVINQSGTIAPLSPSGTSTTLELSGSYYLP